MLNRRRLLQSGAALGALSLMPGMSGQAFAATTSLRAYWWGSPDRQRRTEEVFELFHQQFPDIELRGEVAGADYWTKLATMLAASSMPNIWQSEPTSIKGYFERGGMDPLDQYFGNTIRTDRLAPGTLDLSRIGDQHAGLAIGTNSIAIIHDADAYAEAGVTPPSSDMTWQDFADTAIEMTRASDKRNFWGSPNASRYYYAFNAWMYQRGSAVYLADGKIGYTADDAHEWYAYWDALNAAGALVPPDIQSLDTELIDNNPMTTGNTPMAFAFSNQLSGYQGVLPGKLALSDIPVHEAGGASGLFYRPALIWCIGRNASNPEQAAQFIDFFINDQSAAKILQVERGVPVNLDSRTTIASDLDELAGQSLDYVQRIESRVQPFVALSPDGATEFERTVMRGIADQLAFGQIDVRQAGDRLYEEGIRLFGA